tara:strand:- start:1093 stop:1227 length:135 start_codon:yes stop_codon:yes gene_type:complete
MVQGNAPLEENNASVAVPAFFLHEKLGSEDAILLVGCARLADLS